MQYQEFLDHIYRKYSGNVKLELDRMSNLLTDMGSPQNSLRGFHIGGTNGKGSVCATLESLCLVHGLSTGLNTSPHLIDYGERFRVNGRELPFQQILSTFHRLESLFTDGLVAKDPQWLGITGAVHTSVLGNEGTLCTDHLGECVHETGGIAACQHDQDPLITELPDVFYGTGVDPPVPVGEGAIDIGDEPLQHCLSPASSTMKGASPSGRFGLSTSRAIRLPPLLFRR